jgi:hypothetical protein
MTLVIDDEGALSDGSDDVVAEARPEWGNDRWHNAYVTYDAVALEGMAGPGRLEGMAGPGRLEGMAGPGRLEGMAGPCRLSPPERTELTQLWWSMLDVDAVKVDGDVRTRYMTAQILETYRLPPFDGDRLSLEDFAAAFLRPETGDVVRRISVLELGWLVRTGWLPAEVIADFDQNRLMRPHTLSDRCRDNIQLMLAPV